MPKVKGHIATGAAIQLALAMMSSGKARSKREAAQLAGIHESNLKPQALSRFAQNNPLGRALSQQVPDFLTITAVVGGKRVSARDALSSGVEASVRVLETLGRKVGKLNKAQRAHLLDAKRWIEMSRAAGLFSPPSLPAPVPGELAQTPNSAPDSESIPGSISEFVDDDETPVEDEDTATDCKVDA